MLFIWEQNSLCNNLRLMSTLCETKKMIVDLMNEEIDSFTNKKFNKTRS